MVPLPSKKKNIELVTKLQSVEQTAETKLLEKIVNTSREHSLTSDSELNKT